jgi:hypothetical protein
VASARFYHSIAIEIAFDDPKFRQIVFDDDPRYLSLKYDAAMQSPKMSGEVEIHVHLPDKAAAVRMLREKGAVMTVAGHAAPTAP